MTELEAEVYELTRQARDYPFLAALEPFRNRLQSMKSQSAQWFITDAPRHEDDLLNPKEDILDKVKSFMGGAQRGIYDEARNTITQQQANIEYVDPEAAQKIRDVLADPACHQGNAIQDLKSALYDLKKKVDLKVLEERKGVMAAVDEVSAKVTQMPEFQGLDAEKQAQITNRLDSEKSGLDSINLIPLLQNKANNARAQLLAEIINLVDHLARPTPTSTDKNTGWNETPGAAPREPTTVLASQLKVASAKTVLLNEDDVADYLDEFKKTLLAEIHADRLTWTPTRSKNSPKPPATC